MKYRDWVKIDGRMEVLEVAGSGCVLRGANGGLTWAAGVAIAVVSEMKGDVHTGRNIPVLVTIGTTKPKVHSPNDNDPMGFGS